MSSQQPQPEVGEVISAVTSRMKIRGRSDEEISHIVDILVANALSSREALLSSDYRLWISLGLPVGLMMQVEKDLNKGDNDVVPTGIGPVRASSSEKAPKSEPYNTSGKKQFVTVGTHKEEVIEWQSENNIAHLQILQRTVETYGGTNDEDSRRITWQFLEMKPRELPRTLFSASATFPLNGVERSFRGPWVTRKKDAQRACAKYALENIETHLPSNDREKMEKSILASRDNPIGEANTKLQKFFGKSPGKFHWRIETIAGESPLIFRAILCTDCLDGQQFIGVAADGKEAKFNAARQLISFLEKQQPAVEKEKPTSEVVFYEDPEGAYKSE